MLIELLFLFTLCFFFKSIQLAFIFSRNISVLTRIKTRVVFPKPPLLRRRVETSIFPFWFQGVREPVPLNALPTLLTLMFG